MKKNPITYTFISARLLTVSLFGPIVVTGCSCNSNSSKYEDKEPHQTAPDSTSEKNTETTTHSDTVSPDTDKETSTESDTILAAPWEWQDNPASEDCGPGCRQVTFEHSVRENEWDIWDNLLVYSDSWWRVFVVDLENDKFLQIPDVHPEYASRPDRTSDSRALNPAVYHQMVYYTLGVDTSPYTHEIIRADLSTNEQMVIWERQLPYDNVEDGYHSPMGVDAYGDRVVSESGAGNPLFWTLSVFEPPWPTEGRALIDDRNFGAFNSLWEETLVFWELADGFVENIKGYDFGKEAFFAVTDDSEYQFTPRIHKRRVVYMDLRLGESDTRGNWEHGAVFMKDLDTGEVTRITGGETLAAYPDIHDDIIVWMDYRDCDNPNNKDDHSHIEIWGYDLRTETEFQITDLPDWPKGFPRVWEDKVYVHMFREFAGGNAIYQFDLPREGR